MAELGGVTIRAAEAPDAAAYRELRLEALKAHPEAFGSDHAEAAALPERHWLERVSFPEGRSRQNLFLAEVGGALIGSAGVYADKPVKLRHIGTVVGVYVRAAWRRQGVADRLLARCVDWARAAGFVRLRLAVAAVNTAAVAAYARAGFVVYGLEPDVIFTGGRYYDELLMTRDLRVAG